MAMNEGPTIGVIAPTAHPRCHRDRDCRPWSGAGCGANPGFWMLDRAPSSSASRVRSASTVDGTCWRFTPEPIMCTWLWRHGVPPRTSYAVSSRGQPDGSCKPVSCRPRRRFGPGMPAQSTYGHRPLGTARCTTCFSAKTAMPKPRDPDRSLTVAVLNHAAGAAWLMTQPNL
jgi:hypothetical protein